MAVKILRIITRMNIGGPSRHAAILSTRCDPSRVETCLVTGRPAPEEGDMSDLALSSGAARVIRVPSLQRELNPWRDLLALAALLRLVWRERPRIIHTHMAKAGTLGRLAGILYNAWGPGRRRRAWLVHTFHGHVLDGYFSPRKARLFLGIERWLARRTDCLVAVSDAVRRELLEKGIGRPEHWRVIPLGLELATLDELPLPEPGPQFRVGLVGRLVPIKRPDVFLRGIAGAAHGSQPAPAMAAVVGDGELRATMEREVSRLGLESFVRFTGWQRDLAAVYGSLDAVCLTSDNEGTPVALIEAMAAGRAVIATDVGGVRDVVGAPADAIAPGGFSEAPRGLLIRAGDADGLTAALRALAERPELRRRLGEAARRNVMTTYSAQRLVRDVTNLYETLDTKEATCTS